MGTKVDGDVTKMLCMQRGQVVEGGEEYRLWELVGQGLENWSYAAENTSIDKLVSMELQFADWFIANLPGTKNE